MKKTPFITKAITFATRVHKGQYRKGKDIPAITHLMAVGEILAWQTDDESVVAAGILHDTIEDCKPYGSVTKEMIASEFNRSVARMVNDVTEQDKTLPWDVRKQLALDHIKYMKHDSLLVKTSDILHNLSELVEDLKRDGPSVLDLFNGTREETIARYYKLEAELTRVWPENPLLGKLHEKMYTFGKVTNTDLLH